MDPARRLELGQWFTPPAVADLALALALPRDRAAVRLLDPACGEVPPPRQAPPAMAAE